MAPPSVRQPVGSRLVFTLLVFVVAWGAFAIARGPGELTSYAGHSLVVTALAVGAGIGMALAGLVLPSGRSSRLIGDLALIAAFIWFAPIYVGWNGGPPLVRTIAMVVAGFGFPVLFHLIVAYPSGRLAPIPRMLVWIVYVEAALVSAGRALVRDPFFDPTCWANCTDNVFLLRSLPDLARAIDVAHRSFTFGTAVVLAGWCIWQLTADSAVGRRALLPVLGAAIVLAASVGAHALAQLRFRIESPAEPVFLAIFVTGCAALILLATGLLWTTARTRLQRRAVARIVADLGAAPPPGSLESALGQAVGDPGLRLVYWLTEAGRLVDTDGLPASAPVAESGRAVATISRNDRPIALVSHAGRLPDIEEELGPATLLALENERLQAESLAHLNELQESRRRIIETGDAERKRLERDLHDGAQQRLLAVSYDLRRALNDAEAENDVEVRTLLTHAVDRAQFALDELRQLAHGIYPAILGEAGLAAALASVADTAPLRVDIRGLPDERYPSSVETAAYLLVVESLNDAAKRSASYATITCARSDEHFEITVHSDVSEQSSLLTDIGDRVGALGGTLEIGPTGIRAEIPCA